MLRAVLLLIPVALVASLVLTFIVRAAGRRAALHDSPGASGHIKPEVRRVPNIGGVAIFWTIAAFMAKGLAAAWLLPAETLQAWLPQAVEHIPGVKTQTPMALGLLGCLFVLHVVGLIDDRRALGAMPKLLLMLGAAAVMAWWFDVRLLTMLDAHVGGRWLSVLLTVLWLAGVTNAMNFMDNMDGLAAGVGAVAGGLFLAAAVLHGQWFVAGTLAVLVGALLGFLVFNFPWGNRRASIYMGDGGSLVVGFLLAFLTVRTTYFGEPAGAAPGGAWYGVFMPVCVLAVPLYDFVSVTVIRLSQGRSPFVGDQQHFSHRLRARGLSVRQTLAVIYGCAGLTGIGGIVLGSLSGWQAALVGVQAVLVLVLLGIFEHGAGNPAAPSKGQV